MTEKEYEAIEMIGQCGGYDGGHHKQWVIDQTLRILLGDEMYPKWLETHCKGEDGLNTYGWDEGIPP